MKRSEINTILRTCDDFIRSQGFALPPFAYWSPDEWAARGPECRSIVEGQMGWDITDFGSGDFNRTGLFLFTLRNGLPSNWETLQGKLYAEKILVVGDGQETPLHFHWSKMEDIINRGGGRLLIQLYRSTPEEGLDERRQIEVSQDGVHKTVAPGSILALSPGESITLPQGLYHKFWGEGYVLVGEVSMVNDDHRDNRFYEPAGRFPQIEEDVEPLHLLVGDYARYYRHGTE